MRIHEAQIQHHSYVLHPNIGTQTGKFLNPIWLLLQKTIRRRVVRGIRSLLARVRASAESWCKVLRVQAKWLELNIIVSAFTG